MDGKRTRALLKNTVTLEISSRALHIARKGIRSTGIYIEGKRKKYC